MHSVRHSLITTQLTYAHVLWVHYGFIYAISKTNFLAHYYRGVDSNEQTNDEHTISFISSCGGEKIVEWKCERNACHAWSFSTPKQLIPFFTLFAFHSVIGKNNWNKCVHRSMRFYFTLNLTWNTNFRRCPRAWAFSCCILFRFTIYYPVFRWMDGNQEASQLARTYRNIWPKQTDWCTTIRMVCAK